MFLHEQMIFLIKCKDVYVRANDSIQKCLATDQSPVLRSSDVTLRRCCRKRQEGFRYAASSFIGTSQILPVRSHCMYWRHATSAAKNFPQTQMSCIYKLLLQSYFFKYRNKHLILKWTCYSGCFYIKVIS